MSTRRLRDDPERNASHFSGLLGSLSPYVRYNHILFASIVVTGGLSAAFHKYGHGFFA
jgi:hypothetical protein